MFGIFHLVQYARRLHADRERARMEKMFLDLPIELQKDIGWPAIKEKPPVILSQPAQCCSPAQ